MNKREKLIGYAVKYSGDYNKIIKALEKNEQIEMDISMYQAITILDDIYPFKLKELASPPIVLFYKGDINLINNETVGIVGSRKISTYGSLITKMIVNQIKDKYTLVSGLAMGVDACVHLNCLDKHTIGVLGCGIDCIYPKCNLYLYDEMKINHLILSEYPADTKPQKYYFPFRNRIISALSKFIIVTQAKEKSGTMYTVNEALNICRDIYVVPYRLDDKDGDGCNSLIQQGANILLIEDIKCL
jgi:DNA processing protein